MTNEELREHMRETLKLLGAHPLLVAAAAEYCVTSSGTLWVNLARGTIGADGARICDIMPEGYLDKLREICDATGKELSECVGEHPLPPDELLATLDAYAVDHKAPEGARPKGNMCKLVHGASLRIQPRPMPIVDNNPEYWNIGTYLGGGTVSKNSDASLKVSPYISNSGSSSGNTP